MLCSCFADNSDDSSSEHACFSGMMDAADLNIHGPELGEGASGKVQTYSHALCLSTVIQTGCIAIRPAGIFKWLHSVGSAAASPAQTAIILLSGLMYRYTKQISMLVYAGAQGKPPWHHAGSCQDY